MKKIIVFLLILCVVAAALFSTCSLHSSPKTFIIKNAPTKKTSAPRCVCTNYFCSAIYFVS